MALRHGSASPTAIAWPHANPGEEHHDRAQDGADQHVGHVVQATDDPGHRDEDGE